MDVVKPCLKLVNRVLPCFARAAVGVLYRRELDGVYQEHFERLMKDDAENWGEAIDASNMASRIASTYYCDERDEILKRIIG